MLQIRTSSVAAGQAAAARRLPLRTVLLALGAAVAVALSLPVADAAAARPTKAERLEARSMCALERGVTKSERRMFRSAYGGRSINRAFRRCVKRQAGRLAAKRVRRRNNALAPPGLLPGPAPAPVAPGLPAFPEMPGVRLQCQMEQMEDPLGFAQEYPGPDPVGLCTQMESMP
jgi:hypothetical protein